MTVTCGIFFPFLNLYITEYFISMCMNGLIQNLPVYHQMNVDMDPMVQTYDIKKKNYLGGFHDY